MESSMKKIGKEVLFLKTGEHNPRNGESTFVRLRDGRIMFAYTEYYGGNDWQDHCTARISACYSSDEGETWTAPAILIHKPDSAQNIMSPSLLRLPDGDLGIVFLLKNVEEDLGVSCMPVFSRSDDEGATWSKPISCGMPLGYYCAINDGVIVTREGKIMVPMSYHGERENALKRMKTPPKKRPADVRFAVSDDSGKTWHPHPHVLVSPCVDLVGLAEPGMFEHENGDLWVYMRTCLGHQYQALYTKAQDSWSPVEVNIRFTSPDAPMRVKRVGELVAAVYNPLPYNCLRTDREVWGSPKRTPLVISFSKDDGRSFDDRCLAYVYGHNLDELVQNTYLLEDDPKDSYCYPSILEVKDGFLVSYYHSNGSPVCLNASKMVKVTYDELDA